MRTDSSAGSASPTEGIPAARSAGGEWVKSTTRRHDRLLAILIFCLLLAGGKALAGGISEPALSLSEAMEQAIAVSPQVKAAQARLAGIRGKTAEVWSSVFPQVNISSSLSRSDLSGAGNSSGTLGGAGGFPGTGGSAPGGGIAGLPAGGSIGASGGLGGGLSGLVANNAQLTTPTAFHQLQNSLALNQIIFDGFRTKSSLEIAELSERSSQLDITANRHKVAFETAGAFLALLRSEALQEVASQSVWQARSYLTVAELRLQTGTGTLLDKLQATAALANARQQALRAKNATELARIALGVLLGRTVEAKLKPPTIAAAEVELPHDLAAAIAKRSELQQLELKIALDQEIIVLQDRASWPVASAIGQLSWQGSGGSRYSFVGIQANWPIFDAGKVNAKVQQAHSDLAADRALRDGLRLNFELEIQKALGERAEAQERIGVAREGLSAAKEAFRLAQIRFKAGAGTSYEVIDAQSMLTQAEGNLINAQFDAQLAEIRLTQALGVEPGSLLGQSKRNRE
ncbi:MAG: TolC family protein [Cyanobacteria bacterium NC_groundwater_1444_Ag_S-0.65um_54_12]|nr:TolC family protein [Cyanobacteria bacterium NC_groundwater_1444_Ag_S-0.65um_54_12]